ncbi:MAG TPA: VTT domain-containing protein [Verrucomicrobiae bacterium]|nr:VTT domain-containing protein [Verrucomicrobiae bacterium]
MAELQTLLTNAPWLIYVAVLLGPFVQEDTAVFGAAAFSAADQGDPWLLFAAVLLGLTASDIWKYWAGRYLPRAPYVGRLLTHPRLQAVRGAVLERLTGSLIAARFIPGTRIPLYVACGLFGADFKHFIVVLVLAGAFYVGVAFALFAALGQAGSHHFTTTAPLVFIALILLAFAAHGARRLLRPISVSNA